MIMVTIILVQQAWLGLLMSRITHDSIITKIEKNSHDNKNNQRPRQYSNRTLNSSSVSEKSRAFSATTTIPDGRYLIVRHIQSGQGTGQVLAGLFASHLLGREFQRIVCMSPEYQAFYQAFQAKQKECHPSILESILKETPPSRNITVTINNYQSPPSDCWIRKRLSSLHEEDKILYYVGNTYPKWPLPPPSVTFDRFYEPTTALLDALPYTEFPATVVHLRLEDGILDARPGLEDTTLNTLGRVLPSNSSTFLVTNNVGWYNFFGEQYGWSHPPWTSVQHSALGQIQWGAQTQQQWRQQQLDANSHNFTSILPSQILQMWSDWYTILKARQVYHTLSDFSLSAIRWNHVHNSGYTIRGTLPIDDGKSYNNSTQLLPELYLQPDYLHDTDTKAAPLKDRNLTCATAGSRSQSQQSTDSSESEALTARKLDLALRLHKRRRIEHPSPTSMSSQVLFAQLRQLQVHQHGNASTHI